MMESIQAYFKQQTKNKYFKHTFLKANKDLQVAFHQGQVEKEILSFFKQQILDEVPQIL